jgi:hypothetical protein
MDEDGPQLAIVVLLQARQIGLGEGLQGPANLVLGEVGVIRLVVDEVDIAIYISVVQLKEVISHTILDPKHIDSHTSNLKEV